MENKDLQEFWKNHIDKWKSGEEKQSAYCRQNNLLLNRFNYWKRKFADNPEHLKEIRVVKLPVIDGSPIHNKNDDLLAIHLDKTGKMKINLQFDFDLSKVLFK